MGRDHARRRRTQAPGLAQHGPARYVPESLHARCRPPRHRQGDYSRCPTPLEAHPRARNPVRRVQGRAEIGHEGFTHRYAGQSEELIVAPVRPAGDDISLAPGRGGGIFRAFPGLRRRVHGGAQRDLHLPGRARRAPDRHGPLRRHRVPADLPHRRSASPVAWRRSTRKNSGLRASRPASS